MLFCKSLIVGAIGVVQKLHDIQSVLQVSGLVSLWDAATCKLDVFTKVGPCRELCMTVYASRQTV